MSTFNYRGQVIDQKTNKPILNVTVTLMAKQGRRNVPKETVKVGTKGDFKISFTDEFLPAGTIATFQVKDDKGKILPNKVKIALKISQRPTYVEIPVTVSKPPKPQEETYTLWVRVKSEIQLDWDALSVECYEIISQDSSRIGIKRLTSRGLATFLFERKNIKSKSKTLKLFFKVLTANQVFYDGKVLGEVFSKITPGRHTIDISIKRPVEEKQFFVSGTVLNLDQSIHNEISVLAYDVDLLGASKFKSAKSIRDLSAIKGLEFLGSSALNENNEYQVWFSSSQFKDNERGLADVVAYAIRKNEVVGISRLAFKKEYDSDNRLLNLDIALEENKDYRSEFDQVFPLAKKFVEEVKLTLGAIASSQEQLNLVAEEIDWPIDKVSLLTRAALIHEESKARAVLIELVYGIGRQNISLTWENLHTTSQDVLRNAIQKSQDENIINPQYDQVVQAFLDALKTHTAKRLLESKEGDFKILNDLLKLSLSKVNDRIAFEKAKNLYQGTDENEFWNTYLPKQSGFKDDTIRNIRNTEKLFFLTGAYLPVVTELSKSGVDDLSSLVKWGTENWKNLVSKTGTPDGIPGRTKQEKIANYAVALRNSLNSAYATKAVNHKISTNEIEINSQSLQGEISTFIQTEEEFDIKFNNIGDFSNQIVNAEVEQELKVLQRLVRINPDTSHIGALRRLGFNSATAIAEFSPKIFYKQFANDLGGIENARLIHGNARIIDSKVNLVETGMRIYNDNFLPQWLNDRIRLDGTRDFIEERFPGYSAMFSLNQCACNHCESVFSPSAYFVDLMRFLQRGLTNDEGDSPLDIFQDRRPDLFHLPLTCENSHSLIPYIDLVNEVMESYIFYTHENEVENFENFKSNDVDGATEDELRAQAQHTVIQAYKILAEEPVYPASLPFNLPLETIKEFTAQLGSSWYNILETAIPFTSTDINSGLLIASYLNLSEKEFAAITGNDIDGGDSFASDYWAYFGYDSASDLQSSLASIPEFLSRTELKYEQLVNLIRTKFINPNLQALAYLEYVINPVEGLDGSEAFEALKAVVEDGRALPEAIVDALNANSIGQENFVEWVTANFNRIRNTLTIYQPTSDCDLSSMAIRTISNLYETPEFVWAESLCLKINAFLRLSRSTGWTTQQLDTLLSALSIEAINTENFHLIVSAKKFTDQTETDVKDTAVLWGPMGYFSEDSLYQNLFLGRDLLFQSVDENERSVFAVVAGQTPFHNEMTPLADVLVELASILGVSEPDLISIFDADEVDQSQPISLDVVSLAYRYVWFADLCELQVNELIQLTDVLNLDVFSSPQHSLDAYKKIEQFKASNLELLDLAFVLGNLEIEGIDYSELIETLIQEYDRIDNLELDLDDTEVPAEVRRELKQNLTYNTIGDYLDLSSEITEALIVDRANGFFTDVDRTAFQNFMLTLERAALALQSFELAQEEAIFFIEHGSDFGGLDFLNLNPTAFWVVHDYVEFRRVLPAELDSQISILGLAYSDSYVTDELIVEQIVQSTGWREEDVQQLLSLYQDRADLRYHELLYAMHEAMLQSRSMGLTVASFIQLVPESWTFETLWEKSQLFKRIVRSRYGKESWISVSTKINDNLRELQRDALISYLLTLENIKDNNITDPDGLYEFFLIDVQMSACMDTSRIVQASAAIQQFVNRINLNLEDNIPQDALDRERWKWMKEYRVWEAQMRIWYENPVYLRPEWRIGKSEFFEELESHLTQNDITERTVETALRAYLKSMDEVGNIKVAGLYEEKDGDANPGMVHVFGHTQHMPFKYFYRTFNPKYEKWSPWKKVDTAIQPVVAKEEGEKSGVHLIPVVWKNRLILFWPEFTEKTEPPVSSGMSFREMAEKTPSSPKKYWELRLAWSEYYNNLWLPKKITNEYIIVEKGWVKTNFLNELSFNTKFIDSMLQISLEPNLSKVHVNRGTTYWFRSYFKFDHYNAPEEIGEVQNPITSYESTLEFTSKNPQLKHYSLKFMGLSTNKNLEINNTVLNERLRYDLFFPNDFGYHDDALNYPFFYSTTTRNYFVQNKPLIFSLPQGYLGNIGFYIGGGSFTGVNLPELQTPAVQIINPKLNFNTFHHPFVSDFISNLNRNGIGTGKKERPGLMDSDTLEFTEEFEPYDDEGQGFENTFDPNFFMVSKPSDLSNPLKTYYKDTIDFSPKGANSIYNWELFYHAPLYIATSLSKNGKFEEALKWYHYIFDPTTDEVPLVGLEEISRFWKVKPFKHIQGDDFQDFIDELEANSGVENPIIAEWRENPFDPHIVADNFHVNYKKYTLISYVENLVNWADSKFRKFTRENVYEATQLYVIASNILGPRPEMINAQGTKKKETFDSLKNKLNDLSNARVELENSLGFSSGIYDLDDIADPSISGTGSAFYFCLPPNQKLLKFWEIVEDRLYKIRNCKDIEGISRRLALFAPPIDPELLIKAKSAGLDLDTILSELNTPNPHYRFNYLLRKANEFCNDLKQLGNALLSAIEKEDAEAFSQLRSSHETGMLKLVQGIKERQVLEAKQAIRQLNKQRESAISRFRYYNEMLLGNEPVEIPPAVSLNANLDDSSLISTNAALQEIVPDVDVNLVEGGDRGLRLIPREKEDLDLRLAGITLTTVAGATKLAASVAALFPKIGTKGQPLGVGVEASFGGQNIAFGLQNISESSQSIANVLGQSAALASTNASYIRREQEWTNQANMTIREIENLELQILSAGIRLQVAEKDLNNHKKQIKNTEIIEQYIKDKFTNKELYSWMKDELITLHKQSYDLAFEMAKKAEAALVFEKSISEGLSVIDYSYWENSRFGLLAGEKLQLALRQLEVAYQERNTRQLELTKHISLKMLNPTELIKLQETGICRLSIPEELFDLDYPGHYKRMIKAVSLSIPCIVGPYTSIPCTLRLSSSEIRLEADLSDSVLDSRVIPVDAIATSSAQNDSGVFELNFRDERYVPFEGAGAISSWDIELFHDSEADDHGKSLRQFDYSTISDVIMHVRYTAENGGSIFKNEVITHLNSYFQGDENSLSAVIIEPKHRFSSEWHRFLNPSDEASANVLNLPLTPNLFSYRDGLRTLNINSITLIAKCSESESYNVTLNPPLGTGSDVLTLNPEPSVGNLHFASKDTSGAAINLDFSTEQIWTLRIESPSGNNLADNELEDLFLILSYNWAE